MFVIAQQNVGAKILRFVLLTQDDTLLGRWMLNRMSLSYKGHYRETTYSELYHSTINLGLQEQKPTKIMRKCKTISVKTAFDETFIKI